MSKLVVAARVFLGVIFFVFGLNGFLHFLPEPEQTGPAADFLGAMAATGYFFPFLKASEAVCGLLLLINRYVPLALTILAPIVLNIVLFHGFLAPAGIVPGLLTLGLGLFLAWAYRGSFRSVLAAKAAPDAAS